MTRAGTTARLSMLHPMLMAALALLFGVAAASDFWNVIEAVISPDYELAPITALHVLAGSFATAASYGIARRWRWAPGAVLGWGATDTVLLAVLPVLVDVGGPAGRIGIWASAVAIALVALAIAAYLRARTRAP
jgi:hypothetical protein